MNQEEITTVKKTIRNFLDPSIKFPSEFEIFFKRWALLNSYYNTYSDTYFPNLGGDRKRVLNFGRKFSFIFAKIEENKIKVLIEPECVGKGKNGSKPDKYVKEATNQLRVKLSLSDGCANCSPEKKIRCDNLPDVTYSFDPFEALMRIIYQIRCNLFHGDKLVFEGNQYERNLKLIKTSNLILVRVLDEISNFKLNDAKTDPVLKKS